MLINLRWDLYTIGISISAILILGTVVFFQDSKSFTNKFFLFFTISSSFWGILNYLSYQIYNPMYAIWIIRLVMAFALFQSLFFYLFVRNFPNVKLVISKNELSFVTLVTFFVCLLTLSPFVFSGVKIVAGSTPNPIPGPGILVFALFAISLIFLSIMQIFLRVLKLHGKEKLQNLYLLIGVILMFSLIIIFNFIFVAIFNNSIFIPFSGVFVLSFVFFTFYAIFKHDLMDVRVVGAEILTFLLLVISFFEIILSSSIIEVIIRVIIFVVLSLFGLMLIRSVVKEVSQKEELEKLTKKLKELDDRKNEFISVAAHELRTPLTAIKGYISMILDGDAGKISSTANDFLQDSAVSTDRMIRLVNNLLNVGRIEEKRIVYQTVDCKLTEIVKPVFNQFMLEAKHKGIEYVLDIPTDLVDDVFIDKDRFPEVMINFISNAIKYTDTGKVTVKLSNPKADTIKFEVIDTGPGISVEEQKRLFQKFYRAKSTAGKTIGTGLGLYVSKLLVEKFKGKIGVIASNGKGCNFWFELPIAKNQSNIEKLQNDKSTS